MCSGAEARAEPANRGHNAPDMHRQLPNQKHRSARSLGVIALAAIAFACQMDAPDSSPLDTDMPEVTAAKRVTIGNVEWYVDYEDALAIARAQDKALWVHFGEDPG